MNGSMAIQKELPSDAHDDWIGVFRQRGVWNLDRPGIERWVARNAAFFGLMQKLLPSQSNILELGCGPGRHALGATTLGFRVVGIDVDPEIVLQARHNAHATALEAQATFEVGNMFDLKGFAPPGRFQAITHGGVMEHLDSAESIRAALRAQLAVVPTVIFDVPIDSPKNRHLFKRDTIFRQMWTPQEWTDKVLAGLPIAEALTDLHQEDNMTDDLVVALRV